MLPWSTFVYSITAKLCIYAMEFTLLDHMALLHFIETTWVAVQRGWTGHKLYFRKKNNPLSKRCFSHIKPICYKKFNQIALNTICNRRNFEEYCLVICKYPILMFSWILFSWFGRSASRGKPPSSCLSPTVCHTLICFVESLSDGPRSCLILLPLHLSGSPTATNRIH
jgi:hypothetical protein